LYEQNYAHPITVDVPIVQNSKWYLYEELRAISTDSGPFHFLGGATYLKDHFLGKTTNLLFPPIYTVPIPPVSAATRTFVQSTDEVKNWSVYGQVGYDFTSKLSLTVSGRYIHETNDAVFTNPVISQSSIDAKKFLPSATLSYQLDGGGNVYARYAKGFKAGGVNPIVPPTFFPTSNGKVFAPEQVNAYEIGFKDELLDHRVQVTSAIFYNDYTGLQSTTSGNYQHPALILAIINAGSAETYGAEGSVTWRVIRPVTLSANVGYLQAKYLNFANTDGSVFNTYNFSGYRMINSPRWQMGFSAGLDQPLTGNLSLTGTWLTSYTGDVITAYTTFPGLPNAKIPQFWLTNIRMGVKTSDDRYQVSVFANNAFNRAYYTFHSLSGLGGDAVWGNPRIIGAEFQVKFH
jgi:iron complex outermembrane receptor protein